MEDIATQKNDKNFRRPYLIAIIAYHFIGILLNFFLHLDTDAIEY